jgi:two-component system response regulator YesN
MKQDPVQATFSHLVLSGTLVHEGSFQEMQEAFGIGVHPQVVMMISIDRYPDLVIGKPFHCRMEMDIKWWKACAKLSPFRLSGCG